MPKKANRAPHGSGSIRQRADGRWEGRITLGKDPGTGKQTRRSMYGDTQADVLKLMRELQNDIDNGVNVDPCKLTLGAWLDLWLKNYTSDLKSSTLASYTGNVNHRIKPALGAVKLQKLTQSQIQAFYISLNTGDDALSPKTIKNLHGLLHKALQQAVEGKILKSNPANGCKLPRIEKANINVLDDAQITLFLKAINGHRFQTVYTVTLFTGMRQGEVLGLTWDCVDFDKGTIRIYRQLQLQKGVYNFTSLKNDKERTITPANAIIQMLKSFKKEQTAQQLKAGPAWENKENFVFTNEIGQHLKQKTLYQNFIDILKSIGIEGIRFHDLRHSYAIASLRAGDDIKTLQENLGHHAAAFTLDTYAHATEQMQRESAARMDAFIKSVKEKKA